MVGLEGCSPWSQRLEPKALNHCLTNGLVVKKNVSSYSERMKAIVLLILLGCALPLPTRASGSYTARPPRPPTQKEAAALDREKYALGQNIFTGKAKLKPNADANAAQQEAKLKQLAAKA